MIIKGIALTALVASTPLALFATQDPLQAESKQALEQKAEKNNAETRRLAAELKRQKLSVQHARTELHAAQKELGTISRQLGAALDRLDGTFEPKRERNCSPSRSRMLMSHYQWMRDQGHKQRAVGVLAKVVKQVGDDTGRLNSTAWGLMTNKDTAGKFDEVALALTERLAQVRTTDKRGRGRVDYNHLDTAALANFLNGKVETAIKLQAAAIAKGGKSDDFRRRLRTYQAAQIALAKASRGVMLPAATMIASNEEEEEE